MSIPTIPSTMKALIQPDRLSTDITLTTIPVPTATGPDEHLLRVHSAAITNGELLWPHFFPPTEPLRLLVPTYDVSGTLVTVPANSPFKVGDEVYTRTNYVRPGCAAEYTIVMTDEIALKPKTLTWQQAATVPMSAMTAWQALFEHAGFEPEAQKGAKGKKVFVTAAAGTVGSWVVQLAKWAGAEIVGTCSAENAEYVRSLGAAEAIDYKSVDIKAWVNADAARKADVVIDCVGKTSLQDAWWVVKDDGILVSVYQPPEQMRPEGVAENVKNEFFIMYSSGKQLEVITNLIDESGFLPLLDSVFPLHQFEEAFQKAASGKTKGKVVFDLM